MAYAGPATRGKPILLSASPRPGERPQPAGRSPRSAKSTERPMPSAGVFAAGLGLGLILGAAGALILAPQSGADARRALAKRGRRLRRRGRAAWEDLADELRHMRRRRKARRAEHRREKQRARDELELIDDFSEAS